MRALLSRLFHALLRPLHRPLVNEIRRLHYELGAQRSFQVQARIREFQALKEPLDDLREAEFQVYSQWGEDGILQYLLSRVPLPSVHLSSRVPESRPACETLVSSRISPCTSWHVYTVHEGKSL